MTIVTTSSNKRPKRNPALPIAITAIVIVGVFLFLRVWRRPVAPPIQNPEVSAPTITPTTPSTPPPPPLSTNAVSEIPSETDTGHKIVRRDGDIIIDEKGIMRAADTNNFTKRPGYLMLPSGRILTFKPPAEGDTVRVHSFGRVYECDSEGNFTDITAPPVFDNRFENEMVALSMPGGVFFPSAILNHTPEELDEMLHKEVVINPDDDEKTRHKKEAVAAMKKQILAYLEDGGDFIEFVQRMQQYSKEERRLRGNGMNKLEDLMEAGDLKQARRFLKEYNQILDENYFAPLYLSKKWKEQLYPDGKTPEEWEAEDDAEDKADETDSDNSTEPQGE